MNLEHRVEHLELQYESLDGTVQKILSFTKDTHEILMEHIAETREHVTELRKHMTESKKHMMETRKHMTETGNRFERLEGEISELKSMLKQLLTR